MKKTVILALLFPLLLVPLLRAQRFYPDDPLKKEPTPLHLEEARARKLNMYYDFFEGSFFEPGERHRENATIPSQAVNTLGEVPDSGWHVNRHGRNPMTIEELVRGPGNENPPSKEGAWKVVAAKTEGVTLGFTIEDARGHRYIVKMDPRSNLEMASAADVISSKFFYALGYHVPENYIVYFERRQLVVSPDASITDASGKHRRMTNRDIEEILLHTPRDPVKGYRAVASSYLTGTILGPFRFYGTRSDDPNDLVSHEHRRDLRGLFVFAAWLAHNDAKSLNSLDTLVEEDGIRYIKHHLIDFGASLGSDSFTAKSPRAGNEYLFAWKPAALQVFTLGLYVPRWARAHYPNFPSVGNFESEIFEPEKWKPNYPIPAFENRLPGDTFWAAKQVMAFTDEQIRAIVKTGQYGDPAAEDWVTLNLIARRDKIGRAYFQKVLPLDRFQIEGNRLEFEDLEVKYGIVQSRDYTVQWSHFDNDSEKHTLINGETSFTLPGQVRNAETGSYFAATIRGEDEAITVTVYIRKQSSGYKVVGIDRTW